MKQDEEGFLYPVLDESNCIKCGLCFDVCVYKGNINYDNILETPVVYGAKHINEQIRMSSTSGGAFTAISDYVLKNNGVIFGVCLDENMKVVHKCAKTKEERDKFKGSKYVQSDINEVYDSALNNVDRLTLITGTPCQMAAVKNYMKIKNFNTDNIVFCDIVCHGVNSPLIWQEHVKFIEKKHDSKLVKYKFRDKELGWHRHEERMMFENGDMEFDSNLSKQYKRLFYSHNILRPSCHNCKFTSLKRVSDFTIADFWGIEKVNSVFDDNKGVSLIFLNTNKAKNIFKNIEKDLVLFESNTLDCIQPQLKQSSSISLVKPEFWSDFKVYGYEFVLKKYCGYVK